MFSRFVLFIVTQWLLKRQRQFSQNFPHILSFIYVCKLDIVARKPFLWPNPNFYEGPLKCIIYVLLQLHGLLIYQNEGLDLRKLKNPFNLLSGAPNSKKGQIWYFSDFPCIFIVNCERNMNFSQFTYFFVCSNTKKKFHRKIFRL